MKTFLFLAIALLFYGLKAYAKYQKSKNQNNQTNKNTPPKDQPNNQPQTTVFKPLEELLQEIREQENPPLPNHAQAYFEDEIPDEEEASFSYETIKNESAFFVEEPIKEQEKIFLEENNEVSYAFNIREAIIANTILERKY